MVNAEFESSDEGDYASIDAAAKAATSAATSLVSESIAEGKSTAAIEFRIFEVERLALHRVVSLSVAEMLADD